MVRPPNVRTSFLLHIASSFMMLGIVLITQIVTYPMYRILPDNAVYIYQSTYIIRAFLLMGPIMIVELLSGIHIAMKVKDFRLHSFIRTDMSIIVAIWLVTFLMELPAHFILLNNGLTDLLYRTIMFGNFFRVIAWSIKSWYVLRMVKYFYSYDTAYDYDNLT